MAGTMTGEEQDGEDTRSMDMSPLGEWRIDSAVRCAMLVRPIADAPRSWLERVAPFLDVDAMGVWADEPVSKWATIAEVLRCSERHARNLASAGCFTVDTSCYRARTTLRELWSCVVAKNGEVGRAL